MIYSLLSALYHQMQWREYSPLSEGIAQVSRILHRFLIWEPSLAAPVSPQNAVKKLKDLNKKLFGFSQNKIPKLTTWDPDLETIVLMAASYAFKASIFLLHDKRKLTVVNARPKLPNPTTMYIERQTVSDLVQYQSIYSDKPTSAVVKRTISLPVVGSNKEEDQPQREAKKRKVTFSASTDF